MEEQAITTNNQPPKLTRIRKYINYAEAFRLRNKNITIEEVAKILGCSKENIYQGLIRHYGSADPIGMYKESRTDRTVAIERMAANSLTPEIFKKMDAKGKVWSWAVAWDKAQAAQGLANNIVDIRSVAVTLQGHLADLQARRKEIEDAVSKGVDSSLDTSVDK